MKASKESHTNRISRDGIGKSSDRRSALMTILGGAGVVAGSQALPQSWIKPVFSTALVPAHALTSGACSEIEFTAGSGSGSEIDQIEFGFEMADPEFNGTFSVEFDSEDTIENTAGDFTGTIVNGQGNAESDQWNVELDTGNAVGQELDVLIEIDGAGSCTAETVVFGI